MTNLQGNLSLTKTTSNANRQLPRPLTVALVVLSFAGSMNLARAQQLLPAQQKESTLPLRIRTTFEFDHPADKATAELAGARPKRSAQDRRTNKSSRLDNAGSSFAQSVVRQRAFRNASRDDFRRDVNRMQSQALGVYGGWHWNAEWLPRAGRLLRLSLGSFWK